MAESLPWEQLDHLFRQNVWAVRSRDKKLSSNGNSHRLVPLEERQLLAAAPTGAIESRAISAFGLNRAVFEFDVSPETLGIEAGGSVRLNLQVQRLDSDADPAYPRIRSAEGDRDWLPTASDVVMDDLGGDTDAFRSVELTEGKYRVHVLAEGRVVDPGRMRLMISLAGDADGDRDVDQEDVIAVRTLADSGGYSVEADADRNGVINAADRALLNESLGSAVGFTPFDPRDFDVFVESESILYAEFDQELAEEPTTFVLNTPSGVATSIQRVSQSGDPWALAFEDFAFGSVEVNLPALDDINTFRFRAQNAFGQSVQGEFGFYFNVPGFSGVPVDLNDFDVYASSWQASDAWSDQWSTQSGGIVGGAHGSFEITNIFGSGLAATGIAVGGSRPYSQFTVSDANGDGVINERDLEILGFIEA